MTEFPIPRNHPRAESLLIRRRLAAQLNTGILAPEAMIAHGRGEAFDYLIGEVTTPAARYAIEAAAAILILAEKPVISVNGNVAALTARDVAKLAKASKASVEINLFHRLPGREEAIAKLLRDAGVEEVLGIEPSATIPEVGSDRRKVDPDGILIADVVLVPLEDGDRCEALRKLGKTVVTVDLNPLSRSSQTASISIVDNIVRTLPLLTDEVVRSSKIGVDRLREIVDLFDNQRNLGLILTHILERMKRLSEEKLGITETLPSQRR